MRVIIPLIIFTFLTITGCTTPSENSLEKRIANNMDIQTAQRSSQIVYIDVRTAEEYNAGHVQGAIHIPYDEIESRIQEVMPFRDDKIIVYCRSGRRSGIALGILRKHNFPDVENGGGVEDLRKAGSGITSAF